MALPMTLIAITTFSKNIRRRDGTQRWSARLAAEATAFLLRWDSVAALDRKLGDFWPRCFVRSCRDR